MGLFSGPRRRIAKIDDSYTGARNREERDRAARDGIRELDTIKATSKLKPKEAEWLRNLRDVLERHLENPNDQYRL